MSVIKGQETILGNETMSRQAMLEPAFPVSDAIDAGLQFYNQGHYPAAVRCYRLALRREPESALGHYLLGLTLMAAGDATDAQAEWQAASRSPDAGPETEWARSCAQTLLDQIPSGEPEHPEDDIMGCLLK